MADNERQRHQPAPVRFWYIIATGFLSVFIAMGAGYVYVRHVQDQAADAQRKATVAQDDQRKESLKITCAVVDSTSRFYRSLGTPTANDVAGNWEKLRAIIGCPPSG